MSACVHCGDVGHLEVPLGGHGSSVFDRWCDCPIGLEKKRAYLSPTLPADYEECGECGFDHAYEPTEAHKAHAESKTTMRVYIADLADYNAGKLRGIWLIPTEYQDAAEFSQAVRTFIESVPGHEEWAIHDYEETFGLKVDEYAPLAEVWALGQFLKEHGEAWASFIGYVGERYANESDFLDRYVGQYESGKDYAEELARESLGEKLDAYPFNHIDWESAWTELEHEGCYISEKGHVFCP